eukprot:3335585-Prymnesium_polylepis.1
MRRCVHLWDVTRCRNVVTTVWNKFWTEIRTVMAGDAAEEAAHSDRQRQFEEAQEVQGRAEACAQAAMRS